MFSDDRHFLKILPLLSTILALDGALVAVPLVVIIAVKFVATAKHLIYIYKLCIYNTCN